MHRYAYCLLLPLLFVLGCSAKEPTEFTVVVYNLENVFDVDGVALFDDYQQDVEGDSFSYSRLKLLTKLENAVAVLAGLEAEGPDVILIQELENDFTPESSVEDIGAFIEEFGGTTVREMLTDEWREVYAGFSSVAWLAKTLADAGMEGYHISVAPGKALDSGIAHVNALFSRFPIVQVSYHQTVEARDIMEAELDVAGNSVWLYNNHWKSGASNPKREPTRVENAKVLRRLIDLRLKEDPQADIIVGGDLNSHYNHSILFPEMETGINDVLGSEGDETFEQSDLYNLWFELSPEERYSEVWRGRRGTLMHLLVTPGLYDSKGVSYIDSSYNKLVLAGLNVDALGRPLKWHFAGEGGGGASDHFPVYARFTTAPFEQLSAYSEGDDAPDYEIPLRYEAGMELQLPSGAFLLRLEDDEFATYVNKLFRVEAEIVRWKPVVLRVDSDEIASFVPDRDLFPQLKDAMKDGPAELVVKPGFWRGKRQLVVEGIAQP